MPIITSRACPFKCIYCHNIFGKDYRARSPENIISEIRVLYYKYGIRNFEIWDDLFNLSLNRAKKIVDLIIDSKMYLKIAFPNGLRADKIDEELLYKLKEAGTYHIAVAIETASDRLQKLIKKNLNLKKTFNVIEKISKLGIFTRGFFMLGFPTETKEEILETIRFAQDSKLHMASFFMVNAFKGTELFEMVKNRDGKINFDYSNYDYNIGHFNFSNIPLKEVFKLRRYAYISFYLGNPNRLWNLLLRLPKKRQFLKYIIQFLKRINTR